MVTAAPSYLSYALDRPETQVIRAVGDAQSDVLARAAERDVPVVLLTAGSSASGRAMVAARSGVEQAAGRRWRGPMASIGSFDLAEDVGPTPSELFSLQRPPAEPRLSAVAKPHSHTQRRTQPQHRREELWPIAVGTSMGHGLYFRGIATVHNSGLERAHAADLAEELGVPFRGADQRYD